MPSDRVRSAFIWELNERGGLLREDGAVLLEMTLGTDGTTWFNSGLEQWAVRDRGFWNPRTEVVNQDRIVAELVRPFLGSKARITIGDRSYFCKLTNAPLVRLSVHNSGGVEVLNYALRASPQPEMVFEVRNTWTLRTHLLLLIILGVHAFKGIRSEYMSGDDGVRALHLVQEGGVHRSA